MYMFTVINIVCTILKLLKLFSQEPLVVRVAVAVPRQIRIT